MPLELIIEERGAPARTQVVPADTAFVGRREDCEVVLPYSFVSARHARIQARAGTVFVEDLGSTNGVQVNGEALAPLAPRALGPGDVVQIEKIAIRARVAEVPARAPEPTYHEIRIPASATPRPAAPLPPPPIPAASTPPSVAASTPRVPLPTVLAPPVAPGPRPDPTVVSERSDPTAAIPLRPPSLPEAMEATRAPERLRRRAPGDLVLAARSSGAGPLGSSSRFSGASRYLVLSLVFRGIGLVAVLGGLALLLLVLLA
jgi:ABC transport system ATP-binding/permease protein